MWTWGGRYQEGTGERRRAARRSSTGNARFPEEDSLAGGREAPPEEQEGSDETGSAASLSCGSTGGGEEEGRAGIRSKARKLTAERALDADSANACIIVRCDLRELQRQLLGEPFRKGAITGHTRKAVSETIIHSTFLTNTV